MAGGLQSHMILTRYMATEYFALAEYKARYYEA